MRRPKILQQFTRRVVQAPQKVLSDYPVRFSAVDEDGSVKGEASVPRNRLGELMELARSSALHGLPTIGLHGLTRLQCREAQALAKELRALLQMGESVDPAWLAVVDAVARETSATLVVSAGNL